MAETFANVALTEEQFDQLVDLVGKQSIDSGYNDIYELLLKAVDAEDDDDEDDEEDDE